MKKKFSKILGVGLTLALLCSLLLTAAPVSADVTQATVNLSDDEISATSDYTLTFAVTDALPWDHALEVYDEGNNTGGSATRVSGTTVLLSTGDPASAVTVDTARIVFPYNDTLSSITNLGYSYKLTAGNGTAYWDSAPYIVIALDAVGDNDIADTWVVHHMFALSTGLGTWLDWTLDMTMPRPMVTGNGTDMWHVVGTGAGQYLDWAAVDAVLGSYDVLEIKVAVGGWTSDIDTAHEVKACQINGTAAPSTIEILFPEDFDITAITDVATDDDVTIGASSGVGVTASAATNAVSFTGTTTNTDDTLTAFVPTPIGAGATVQVVVSGVVNNDDIGDYTLEVSTSEETDAVTSGTFTLVVPDVGVLPGIVEAYNPSGILMDSDTGAGAIQAMLAAADEGWTIKIGEGEYTESPNTVEADVTIEGSGDVEDIVVVGNWTIDEDDITIDGLTLDGDLSVTADDFILQNCVVDDGGTLAISAGGTDATVEDTTFNVEDDVGIEVDADDTVITDCTFNIEEDGIGISVADGGTDTDVSDSTTFTGSSGVGINVTNAASILDVEDSTFDGLDTALDIDAGTVGITGNTIQNCAAEAIIVTTAAGITLTANTITGNDDAVLLRVEANADLVQMIFNTITGNAGDDDGLLIDNNDTGTDLYVINNWWGDADGPGDDAFSDDVVSEPFLAGPISANADLDTNVAASTTADFEDTAGVTVVSAGFEMEVVAAAQYTVNPLGAIDDAVGFWDVYVTNATADITGLEVRIYTDVTADTEVWVWGAARGEWLEASTVTPNLFGGFVLVGIDDGTGTPIVADLEGLPFAVIEPPAAADELDAPDIIAPASGATDVRLTPTFVWEPVTDAEGYCFELADNVNFVSPMVQLDDELGRLFVTAYAYVGELPYSTAYYWRVKAVSGAFNPWIQWTQSAHFDVESAWSTGVFITIDEPEEELPPIVVEEAPPVIIEPIVEVITPAATEITPSWIYVIIGVGGVLVIALLVLIVRTRRVA